jgi:diaminopimelate epimerase
MLIEFTKMHGLGNDFVVINNLDGSIKLDSDNIRYISNRNTGVGCDHVLVIYSSNKPSVDVMYRIFNADGNEAEQSGNGVRCLGKYLVDNGMVVENEMTVENTKGLIKIKVNQNGEIQVNMGKPEFEPELIPIKASMKQKKYEVTLNEAEVSLFSLSMGNPHAVILVDDVINADVACIGPLVQQSVMFPEGVNVGFMQILDNKNVKLRVFERGVGETMACGTGACAAAVSGIIDGKLDNNVNVELTGGLLDIRWDGQDSDVWMTGPAMTVFEGKISL